MRCRTGCMSFANPAQSFAGSRRTTRSAPVLAAGVAGFTREAKSADTLVVVDVGTRLIAVLTIRAACVARILIGRGPAASADNQSRESPAGRTGLDSTPRSRAR